MKCLGKERVPIAHLALASMTKVNMHGCVKVCVQSSRVCRSISREKQRQQALMSKWVKPVGGVHAAATLDAELGKYTKRLSALYSASGSTAAGAKRSSKHADKT